LNFTLPFEKILLQNTVDLLPSGKSPSRTPASSGTASVANGKVAENVPRASFPATPPLGFL
jgi:hypothetical protein